MVHLYPDASLGMDRGRTWILELAGADTSGGRDHSSSMALTPRYRSGSRARQAWRDFFRSVDARPVPVYAKSHVCR